MTTDSRTRGTFGQGWLCAPITGTASSHVDNALRADGRRHPYAREGRDRRRARRGRLQALPRHGNPHAQRRGAHDRCGDPADHGRRRRRDGAPGAGRDAEALAARAARRGAAAGPRRRGHLAAAAGLFAGLHRPGSGRDRPPGRAGPPTGHRAPSDAVAHGHLRHRRARQRARGHGRLRQRQRRFRRGRPAAGDHPLRGARERAVRRRLPPRPAARGQRKARRPGRRRTATT